MFEWDWNRVAALEPSTPPLSLGDAKGHLRVVDDDDDADITAYIKASTAQIEGPYGRGIALVKRKWKTTFDGFPPAFRIPMNEVISVEAVKYIDPDGAEQTLVAGTDYRTVFGQRPAIVEPAYNQSWPSYRAVTGAVTLEFTAGYDSDVDVPEDLRTALKIMVEHRFNLRGLAVVGTVISEVPDSAEGIIAQYAASQYAS